jgi:hypothetical protein
MGLRMAPSMEARALSALLRALLTVRFLISVFGQPPEGAARRVVKR